MFNIGSVLAVHCFVYTVVFEQESESFLDTKTMPVVKKNVRPIEEQGEFESRR